MKRCYAICSIFLNDRLSQELNTISYQPSTCLIPKLIPTPKLLQTYLIPTPSLITTFKALYRDSGTLPGPPMDPGPDTSRADLPARPAAPKSEAPVRPETQRDTHVYVYVYIYICIYVQTYTYTYIYIHVYIHIYVHMCIQMNVSMHACMYVCAYVYTHMYILYASIHGHVCIFTQIEAFTYPYMYAHMCLE